MTESERAEELIRRYMAGLHESIPLDDLRRSVLDDLIEEIERGDFEDDPKSRAEVAFRTADNHLRRHGNEVMKREVTGQQAFDVEEHAVILVLAGIDDVGRYTMQDTARCRLGDVGIDEYLRWDHVQYEQVKAIQKAYDAGRQRFAPYQPFFARGLRIRDVDELPEDHEDESGGESDVA